MYCVRSRLGSVFADYNKTGKFYYYLQEVSVCVYYISSRYLSIGSVHYLCVPAPHEQGFDKWIMCGCVSCCISREQRPVSNRTCNGYRAEVCVCESYIGKPIGTRAVPQFTTGVAKPLTQIEPGKTEHHPPV